MNSNKIPNEIPEGHTYIIEDATIIRYQCHKHYGWELDVDFDMDTVRERVADRLICCDHCE